MDKRVYWVHLQQCAGYAAELKGFIEKYKTAENFYKLGAEEWKKCGIKGIARRASKNLNDKDINESQKIVDFCDEHSIYIITPEDKRYPGNLLNIKDFPCVLYVRGNAECLNKGLRIAVIGSRDPTIYGERSATKIVQQLSKEKITIVSGGAIGIDSVAHKTAIFNDCDTILVMGCGHGTNYLPENARLRKAVSRKGALVTEYPPYTAVERFTFPQRNRIISGMSEGVVIIEAAEKSGTFSTARHAVKQNRDVFVLPGDIHSDAFAGSNKLIAENGAKAVFSASNILKTYGYEVSDDKIGSVSDEPFENIDVKMPKEKKKKNNKKSDASRDDEKITSKIENNVNFDVESVSKNAQIVYNIMSDGVCLLDDITRKSALEVRKVLTALVELQMVQAIEMTAPNKYIIKSQ